MVYADWPAAWSLSSPILADLAEGGAVDAESVVLDLVDRFAQLDDLHQARWVEQRCWDVRGCRTCFLVQPDSRWPRTVDDGLEPRISSRS